jgi:hypothetical protein
MKEISPAAQAVLDAYGDFEAANIDAMAAALRAVNEYVVLSKFQYADWQMAKVIHDEIEALATELKAI